jgi:hypothetical protein
MDLSPTRIGLGSFDWRWGDIVFGVKHDGLEISKIYMAASDAMVERLNPRSLCEEDEE